MRPDQPDMNLPAGKTCSDCLRFRSCAGFIGVKGTETHCDWSPSRFCSNAQQADLNRAAADRRSRFVMKDDMTMRTAGSRRSSPAFARMTSGVDMIGLREEGQLRNMLLLCGEEEVSGVKGMPHKMRALIDGLIVQRRRADGKIKIGAFTISQAQNDRVRIDYETGETLVCEGGTLAMALARFWKDNF